MSASLRETEKVSHSTEIVEEAEFPSLRIIAVSGGGAMPERSACGEAEGNHSVACHLA
ncbi:MAG: hypothetical protein ACXW3Z_11955 [Limisphaerales bacterium]